MRLYIIIILLLVLCYVDSKRKHRHGRKHRPKPGKGGKRNDDCVDLKSRKHGPHKHSPKHRRKKKCSGKPKPGPKMPGSELPDTKRPDPVPETSEPKFPDPQTPVPEVSRECGKALLRKVGSDQSLFNLKFTGSLDVQEGYYPWHAAIYNNDIFICSGALVSETKVVTAANCFNFLDKTASNFKVVLGDNDRSKDEVSEQMMSVSKVATHEEYKEEFEDYEHDIATLTLSGKATPTDRVTPICLPEVSDVLNSGRTCYLTGWGESSAVDSKVIQEIQVPIKNRSFCNKNNDFNEFSLNDNMICGGYKDDSIFVNGCHGDGGSPLQCKENGRWLLYGVTSWSSPTCEGNNKFIAYTRLNKYIDWIKQN